MWSLTNPSGTTSGGIGASGADGSTIVTFDDQGNINPKDGNAITTQEQYRQFAINVATFNLWELPPNESPTDVNNFIDHGTFAGSDGVDGAGYSSASYDASTGQVTFAGSGGNADVVTGDLRGVDGVSSTYITGTGEPTSSIGSDGDVYVDLDTGDFYGAKSSGSWGTSTLNIKGVDGTGVDSASTSTGDLVITLSDGTEINAGAVIGQEGGTPNISVGDTTTLDAGSNALVELDNASTSLNKILNFSIPRGANGEQGANGVDGVGFTNTDTISNDTGTIGQIHIDSEQGKMYQKREVNHIESVTISYADFKVDDTNLDPNGKYVFTGFRETSEGDLRAEYALDRNDGSPTPDYIIRFDETESEWELVSNQESSPPPLAKVNLNASDGECNSYFNVNAWSVEAQYYPNSTMPSIVAQEVDIDYIELKEKAVTQVGSFSNEGVKSTLEVPLLKGYVRGVPYFGSTHEFEGKLYTDAIRNEGSELIESTSSMTDVDWKLDQVNLKTTGACEILVYVKTSNNIVVTDDDNVGLGSDYLGVYELQTEASNGKNVYKNDNNKYISWDGTTWDIRDSLEGVSVRRISTQAVNDPSDLTRTETNLLNIYPERKTLNINALQGTTNSTHTNQGTADTIQFTDSFEGTLYLGGLKNEAQYPNVVFQLITKGSSTLSVDFIKYENLTTCWKKIIDVANPNGLGLGDLTNVTEVANTPIYDGSIIKWSEDQSSWIVSGFNATAWHGGYAEPISDLGNDGDFHYNFTSKDISRKESGTWVVKLNTSNGTDGVGIASIEENDGTESGKPAYSLTITLDDTSEFTTSSLKGDAGTNGSASGLPTGGKAYTTGTGLGEIDYSPSMDNSELWIDASKSSTILQNSSSKITGWTDAYAQGNNLVSQGNSSDFPSVSLYTAVDSNFVSIYVPQVGLAPELLQSDDVNDENSEFNFFGVMQKSTTFNNGEILSIGGSDNDGSFRIRVQNNDLVVVSNSNTGTATTTTILDEVDGAGGLEQDGVYLIGIRARNNDYEIRLNGEVKATISENITGSVNSKKLSLGDFNTTAQVQFKHCEWILGLAEISDLQAQQKEGYLAHKWGLTTELHADHPFKSIKPLVEGGSKGQVLQKIGDADYEVAWVDKTPYNRFIPTGITGQFDVLESHHGATILANGGVNSYDIVLPYDVADGWQVFIINRNNNFPIRILAKDSDGGTDIIVPDGGWGIDGDISTASWLRDNGDSCTATWDATLHTWYIIGNARTYEEAFEIVSSQ
jgi:hypothetical protein